MNRKQRRNTPKRDLAKAIRQEGLDATKEAVKVYSVALAYVLYSKQDFDKERTLGTMRQVEDIFDSIKYDYVTVLDIQRCLKEELGVVFTD